MASFEYYDTVAGIIVVGGRSNILCGNNLADNFQGMQFDDTNYNLIVGNNITYSSTAEYWQGYHNPAGIFLTAPQTTRFTAITSRLMYRAGWKFL